MTRLWKWLAAVIAVGSAVLRLLIKSVIIIGYGENIRSLPCSYSNVDLFTMDDAHIYIIASHSAGFH